MNGVENRSADIPLNAVWLAFGYRAAAAVGASTALVSLIQHTPVWVASSRGALAWLAVVVLTRIARWLIDRTSGDAREAPDGASPDAGSPGETL